MSSDLRWEWPWVIAELLAHQHAIEVELERLLVLWDSGDCSSAVAERISDLSEAYEAMAWGRGDFDLG